MPSSKVAPIRQADDTVLISNNLSDLQNLFQLSLDFYSKYHVQLCIEKTKLQVFSKVNMSASVEISKLTSPINIEGKTIPFVDTTNHVGILRDSSASNLPNILDRFKAHRKALNGVLHSGIARNHRGNPAASVKIAQLYGSPVLLSGLGCLVLLRSEVQMIDHHHKIILEKLLRLHPSTPQPEVAFLSGSLPGTALIHQRMLGIFRMICRLPNDILHHHANQVLVGSKPSSKSWFIEIRRLCLQYGLPHPISLLDHPPTKEQLKKLVKKKIDRLLGS